MEITTNDAAAFPSRVRWAAVRAGSIALVIAVYFSGLSVPFVGPDESRYAQVAREMWQSGDWLTPTLGGHPWFEKPPLLYWLEIACYQVFGASEFAARLGPALCGVCVGATLWWFARRESTSSAWLLWLMAASTTGVIAFSHTTGFDIVLTLCLTIVLLSFWKFERARRGTSLLALCYIFTGLAVLAKGLVGLAFPVAVVALFFLLSRRRPPRALITSLLWGIPLVVLIAGPWHVAMYWKYGSEFVDIYFVQHHFERFTSNRYLHPQPVYFFWWVLPLLALPWVLFTPSGIAAARRQDREAGPSLSLFAICWLLVPLTFFSFSGSKLPGYILPSVPPIVILAWTWARIGQTRRALSTATGWLTLGIALAVIWGWLPAYADRDSVKPLVAAADAMGYKDSRVLTLHMVSHNAEFYAAGRLLRDEQGGQAKLEGAQLVLDEINKDGRPVLVLVPVEYAPQLTEYSKVTAKVLAENAGVAIVAVAAK